MPAPSPAEALLVESGAMGATAINGKKGPVIYLAIAAAYAEAALNSAFERRYHCACREAVIALFYTMIPLFIVDPTTLPITLSPTLAAAGPKWVGTRLQESLMWAREARAIPRKPSRRPQRESVNQGDRSL
jgi:hypothetical protein